jgi:hypothetical protein
MKFKEKRGNVFVFDGGYTGEELELVGSHGVYRYNTIHLNEKMHIWCFGIMSYQDIQTAVNLMQILINEGLV